VTHAHRDDPTFRLRSEADAGGNEAQLGLTVIYTCFI
jgi:hypothetical protein